MMTPVHFTVSQIRVAATCPRILYFDAEHSRRKKLKTPAVTRIWKSGSSDTTAGGALFHRTVERFNKLARTAPEVRTVIRTAQGTAELLQGLLRFVNHECVDLGALASRPVPVRQAFISALHGYMRELADILNYASSRDKPVEQMLDELFGDTRRRVDVTFHVGRNGEAVHVTGILDYLYYDWRSSNHRIIDYKLTPSQHSNNDLFQVCTYALMHHHQHATAPNVAVLYLHPERRIVEKTWDQVYAERSKVYDLLASMLEWRRYDERTGRGLKPVGEPLACQHCKWNRHDQCIQRLGPKHEGQRCGHWSETSASGEVAEPPIAVTAAASEKPDTDGIQQETVFSPGPLAGTEPGDPSAARPDGAVSGLRIGEVGGRAIEIDPRVLNTHVAVVGAAGSGKTWMAKILAEEAIGHNVPVLAIDPQGDLVQFLRQNDSEQIPLQWQESHQRFCEKVEPRIFTPGSSHGIRICLSPLRLPTPGDLAHITDPQRRQEEETNILAAVAGNLASLAQAGGEEDSQRTFLFRILKHLLAQHPKSQISLSDVVAAIYSPEAVGVEQAELMIKKSEREKLARKLNNFVEGPSAGLFQGGLALDLDWLTRPHQPGKVPLNVIYLNALADDNAKQFFVAALAAEVYRWMVTSVQTGGAGATNLLFYLDEARDYIPAGARKPPAKEPLIRLLTQGRKYGVGCLLCTQSPRSVDYNAFGNCSTKIVGRIESAQDVERIAQWFSTDGPAPAWISQRKGADKGTFVARWPEMPGDLEGQVFQSRLLSSWHEGAWPPDRVEHEMADNPLRQALLG